MALYQGVLSSSNLRLRGYRVTNGLNFFFNFLSNVRLRGYRVTNRLNFLSLNFQNEKVTRLPGLQGLQWATRLNLIFFETLEHSSQVTRLQGFEGYMVTELQNPPYILPYLEWSTMLSLPFLIHTIWFRHGKTRWPCWPVGANFLGMMLNIPGTFTQFFRCFMQI